MNYLLLLGLVALFLLLRSRRRQILQFLELFPSKSKEKNKDGFTVYTIRPGQHFCDQNFPKRVKGTELSFTVKFDASAVYTLPDPEQADMNKLMGFSEGLNNHGNSARIGWRWYKGQLELCAYVYVDNLLQRNLEFEPPVLGVVSIGEEVTCGIKIDGDSYIFTVAGKSRRMPRGLNTEAILGHTLYPYFGGNCTAPHLITILIK